MRLSPSSVLQPNQIIDERYLLLHPLGKGGQGEVWRAGDRRYPERFVALKRILPPQGQSNQIERIRREAQILSEQNHPALIRCHQIIERPREGDLFLVMDLAEGVSLDHLLQDPRLTWQYRIEILLRCAQALAALHSNRILHRDVKPENIIVSDRFWQDPYILDTVKLVDLGIATEVGNPNPLTQENYIIGTPPYIAPETIAPWDFGVRQPYPTAAVDVFAWGVLAWRFLIGGHPSLLSEMAGSVDFYRVYKNARNQPTWAQNSLPPPLGPLLTHCLSLYPSKRIPDGNVLLQQIQAVRNISWTTVSPRPSSADSSSPSPRQQYPSVVSTNTSQGPASSPSSQQQYPSVVPANTSQEPASSPSSRQQYPSVVSTNTSQGPASSPSSRQQYPSVVPANTSQGPVSTPSAWQTSGPVSTPSAWQQPPPSSSSPLGAEYQRISIPSSSRSSYTSTPTIPFSTPVPLPPPKQPPQTSHHAVIASVLMLSSFLGVGLLGMVGAGLLNRISTSNNTVVGNLPSQSQSQSQSQSKSQSRSQPQPLQPLPQTQPPPGGRPPGVLGLPKKSPSTSNSPPSASPCACGAAATSHPCASGRTSAGTLSCSEDIPESLVWNFRLSHVRLNQGVDGATQSSLDQQDPEATVKTCVQGTHRCQTVRIQDVVKTCGRSSTLQITTQDIRSPGLSFEVFDRYNRLLWSASGSHDTLTAVALCKGAIMNFRNNGISSVGFFLDDP